MAVGGQHQPPIGKEWCKQLDLSRHPGENLGPGYW